MALVFHAFHAGRVGAEAYAGLEDYVGRENRFFATGTTLPAITMPAGMIASASNNHMWISCPNSSAAISCWGAFLVRPDGVILGALPAGETGMLCREIDTAAGFYDSTAAWRERAMRGQFHSGTLVSDPRAGRRDAL